MINSIGVYEDAGRRAGKARRQGDEALAEHEKRWFNQAKQLEKPEDVQAALDAWHEGYRSSRGEIKFEPFR